MAKHKKLDMLIAKGENMDSVILLKYPSIHHWEKSPNSYPPNNTRVEAFLCLPEHEKACLACLNGKPVEIREKSGDWIDGHLGDPWCDSGWYMSENIESRVTPTPEKESPSGKKETPEQPRTLVEQLIENVNRSKKEMAKK